MHTEQAEAAQRFQLEEHPAPATNGMTALVLNILLILVAWAVFVIGITPLPRNRSTCTRAAIVVAGSTDFLSDPSVRRPESTQANEALVLTLFGRYYGTLRGEGFYFVNPFVTGVNPASKQEGTLSGAPEKSPASAKYGNVNITIPNKKLSLKAMTLNNEKQKINDALGNPIIIGIVVIWKVVNTAKAVFNVDNYVEYLSIHAIQRCATSCALAL